MDVPVNAALSMVGKALAPITNGLLESWAASTRLGSNIDDLKMQLLYAQGMLDNTRGRDIHSPALKELLNKLWQLVYGADDVLDELEYFRLQDALDGTYHTADVHAQGCVGGFILNARHTGRATTNKLKLSSFLHDARGGDPNDKEDGGKQGCLCSIFSCGGHEIRLPPPSPTNQGVQEVGSGCMPKVTCCARSAAYTIGKHFPCYSFSSIQDGDAQTVMLESSNMAGSGRRFLYGAWSSKARQRNHAMKTPKMKFDRVKISNKMVEIIEQLKPLCPMVSTILDKELLGCNLTPSQDNTMNRAKTTPKIIEPEFYGRDDQKKNIVDGIIYEQYCANELTVLSLVGPGGIGKTTLTRHIYQELETNFQVSVWVCVSHDFNANKLAQEIVKNIPEVNGEKENGSIEEKIEQRLKSKRLLLVLDDVWKDDEDEWKKLLAPLRYKGGRKGHVVIVTTRFPKVASMVASMVTTTNSSIDVERLGHEHITSFFEVCVFGDQKPWKDYPELRDVGSKIVSNLKGFPLAAKTVGRLLRNKLTLDHWTRVAESREWELQTGPNDIMPALKLSYDYLPFHLQQCFSYCALFPEDYEFGCKELVHLWIGLDILDSQDQKKRIKDVGIRYLDELVNHGFFKRNEKEDGSYYVIHDLLHELATKVSSHECLSIYSSNVRSIYISPSVRHLSIIVDNTDVRDTITFKNYRSDLSALDERLKVQNLRTLMLFGEYHGSFVKTFRDLLRKARALRTIFLSGASYSVEDMLPNFSKLVHLRYLRIKSIYNNDMCLPSALFRLYHLKIIDLEKWQGSFASISQMSNLVKLRHFLVPGNELELHSNIFEVGKLKLLEELRRFEVGKESKGFELNQLRELTELKALGIYNLEKVQEKDEAKEVKLIFKNHLHKLILEWDINRCNENVPQEENVLESLVPHKNLQDLRIRGHKGANCPSWLGTNLSVINLKSLCLYDVSWNKLPPLGEQSFQTLKRLELVRIPISIKLAGNGTCHLFSLLEVIIIEGCPELIELPFSHPIRCQAKQEENMTWFRKLIELPFSHPTCSQAKQEDNRTWFRKLIELPFSHPTCCQAKQEENMTWFPKLRELKIIDCPKLSSLPPVPWTPAPCSYEIKQAGSGFEELVYSKDYNSELILRIKAKDGQSSVLWNALAFHNLADLKELAMENCPPLPLIHLQELKSLKTLRITSMSNVLLLFEGESRNTGCLLPVERIYIQSCGANGKELTQFLSHFPKLSFLYIWDCEKITGLGVVEHQKAAAKAVSSPSSSANKMEDAQTGDQRQHTRGEEELAAEAGLLLLLCNCGELRLLCNSLDSDNAGEGGGGGLQHLCSLLEFSIWGCPKFLSSYSSSTSSCLPFPTSLQSLHLRDIEGMETLAPLSNLISLTHLYVRNCGDLRGDGLWPLAVQGRLTSLHIFKTPKFFTGSEPSRPHDEEGLSCSSKLTHLQTDDLAGILTQPICSLLSSSLTDLSTRDNKDVERFTEEQEEALRLLTSLQYLQFSCYEKLQRLPAGLTNLKRLQVGHCPAIHSLPKDGLPSCLQTLEISGCPAIKSLPKDGLPSCLQTLEIYDCPAIKSLPKDGLPSCLQTLEISYCPAIKSLPKDGLPSSLRELIVLGNSEELQRQCRKLKGTIPIIREYY